MPEDFAKQIEELKREIEELKSKRIHQWDIVREGVKQRHLEGMIIFRGVAADRPDGSTEVVAYFATDTGVLSIWDGSAWLDTTLS